MVSIIIAFDKGREYLIDCLESIREQSEMDIETLLVRDGSEENIDDIILRYKEEINLKTLFLDCRTGVSSARNLGIQKALGEYIYFLDSDDYIIENTFTGLLQTMREDTDIAYGKILHTWFKRAAFNVDQGDAVDDGSEVEGEVRLNNEISTNFKDICDYRLRRCREIDDITCLGVLYRRSFIIENNILFDEDQKYYADCLFWIKVLNCIKGYSYCEDSIYVKRYHNDKINFPSISQIEDEKRDKYFSKAYIDSIHEASKGSCQRECLEFTACRFFVDEYSRRFHDDQGKKINRENFELFTKIIRECDKRTIRRFNFTDMKILNHAKECNMQKVKKWADIRLIKRKFFKMITSRKHLYRTINLYIFNRMREKKNWITFESFVGRNYSGQPKYIYKYLQTNYGDQYKYIWIVNDKKLKIDGKCKKVKRFGLLYYYYMTRSKFWVNNMRQPYSLPKRDSQIMLETWHGTPLKKLVFDMDDVHSANPKYKQIVYKQSRKWDYLLSDNPFSTEKFESCFMFDRDKILELGYPANDPLYAHNIDEEAVRIKNKIGIPSDKKVLLYAPTWRDDISYGAGEYKFELALDLRRLKAELGGEYVILLRMHYWIVDKLDLTGLSDFVINVSGYSDITDIYIVSDICMTDYSSVFFDFANLRRPILFFMYDLEKYRDVLRGFYLDVEIELPGPILTNNDEVISAIKNIDKVAESFSQKYNEFYDRFCCIDDGHAGERVCERVFLDKH